MTPEMRVEMGIISPEVEPEAEKFSEHQPKGKVICIQPYSAKCCGLYRGIIIRTRQNWKMIQTDSKRGGNLENKNNKKWEILGQLSKAFFFASTFFLNSCSLLKLSLSTSSFQMFFSLPSQVAAFLHAFVKKNKVGWCGRELAFQTVWCRLLIHWQLLNCLPTSLLSHVFIGQYRPSQVRHHTALQ